MSVCSPNAQLYIMHCFWAFIPVGFIPVLAFIGQDSLSKLKFQPENVWSSNLSYRTYPRKALAEI